MDGSVRMPKTRAHVCTSSTTRLLSPVLAATESIRSPLFTVPPFVVCPLVC